MDAEDLAEIGLTASLETMRDGAKTLVIRAVATGHTVAIRSTGASTHAPGAWPDHESTTLHLFDRGEAYGPGDTLSRLETPPRPTVTP